MVRFCNCLPEAPRLPLPPLPIQEASYYYEIENITPTSQRRPTILVATPTSQRRPTSLVAEPMPSPITSTSINHLFAPIFISTPITIKQGFSVSEENQYVEISSILNDHQPQKERSFEKMYNTDSIYAVPHSRETKKQGLGSEEDQYEIPRRKVDISSALNDHQLEEQSFEKMYDAEDPIYAVPHSREKKKQVLGSEEDQNEIPRRKVDISSALNDHQLEEQSFENMYDAEDPIYAKPMWRFSRMKNIRVGRKAGRLDKRLHTTPPVQELNSEMSTEQILPTSWSTSPKNSRYHYKRCRDPSPSIPIEKAPPVPIQPSHP